jgi:hypothetical protein
MVVLRAALDYPFADLLAEFYFVSPYEGQL